MENLSRKTAILDDNMGTASETIAKNIKNRLIKLQNEHFESIEDMSRKTGIPESTLASYIRGVRRPGIEKLIDIANAYDISIQWLVGLSEHKKNLVSYRDDASNMYYRYIIESTCVRIQAARPFFSIFHYGEKCNIFYYETFYKDYFKSIEEYIKIQEKRENLVKKGKITLEEIVSLKTLEEYLCSGKIPLECQEELLNNIARSLKYNNYDLIFIDKDIYFNFEIIDNSMVSLELRLANEFFEDRIRKCSIYFYNQTLLNDFREERKYLSSMALKSFTNTQIINLLIKNLSSGIESLKEAFKTIRTREEKLLELMSH